jgi:nitroimidazol reductase NimA-like FMN-containing flavoprotein (pyridoxamine 5'-phosphate oxidase superfamily)
MSKSTATAAPPPSELARVRRVPRRGTYDREVIHAILDDGLVAHVGFSDGGRAIVIPMFYARAGDEVLLHGSSASRLMTLAASGAPLCIAVTAIDGLVLARSAFHHSMNYRSVVVFAAAREIVDPAAKAAALDVFVERLVPGRADEARRANAQELRATRVVAIPLAEASAKIRTGGPIDDAEDLAWPCWAGVIPLTLVAGTPAPDAGIGPDVRIPDTRRRAAARPG